MKKYLYLALIVTCLAVLLAGCGCEHEWEDATCTAPKTCKLCEETEGEALGHTPGEWAITLEPVEGKAGLREQNCTACGDVVTTEDYTLSATHDGTNYTLTVAEYAERLDRILRQIRPELSCRVESNKKGNPCIYVFWQEEGYLTAIVPTTASEDALTDAASCPGKLQNLMQLNTTQQTVGDNPIPVFDLQMDTLQAMIMACDPQISGTEARQIVMDFVEGEEMYIIETRGSLEYYFFLSTLGQPILNLTLSPAA